MSSGSPDNPANVTFAIGQISTGDIVFVDVRPNRVLDRVVRYLNVNGQRLLLALRKDEKISPWKKLPKHSHVMLGLDGGLIIHADGKKVAVEIISDALHYGTEVASHFEVYRRRSLTPELRAQIAKAAIRYYSQKYRFSPFFLDVRETKQARAKKEDTTQFCSRLVASSYRLAGVPISSLPDQKTLPVDLYQACQSDDWQNVTSEFLEQPLGAEINEAMGTIDVPGLPTTTIADFLARADELILGSARMAKEFHEMHYKSVKDIMESEGLLSKYCAARFDIAKKIYTAPAMLDDQSAEWTIRVLQQLESLLALSLMPTLDILVQRSFVNKIDESSSSGAFVGFPSPSAIREMQIAREAVTIYTYLMLAEIGMFSIVADRTQNEKFDRYRSVKPEYVQAFFAAMPQVIELSAYEKAVDLFAWVDDQSERTMCRTLLTNIITAFKICQLNSGQGTRAS
jgi:hypothetical protein